LWFSIVNAETSFENCEEILCVMADTGKVHLGTGTFDVKRNPAAHDRVIHQGNLLSNQFLCLASKAFQIFSPSTCSAFGKLQHFNHEIVGILLME
jgi:hypothetical protein